MFDSDPDAGKPAMPIALCTALSLLLMPASAAGHEPPSIAFIGLHGGVFERLASFQKSLNIRLEYLTDEKISRGDVDLSAFDLVVVQHMRSEQRDDYRNLIREARRRRPDLLILSISGLAEKVLPDLADQGVLVHDEKLAPYYGNNTENLRRLLVYLLVAYLHRPGQIAPPEPFESNGIYHPDHKGLFGDVAAYLAWARSRASGASSIDADRAPRAVVTVHLTHLVIQQPRVIDALIRAFERRGVLAVAMVDLNDAYEGLLRDFSPQVVIHTCHSTDDVALRERLGVPHLHSLFFRGCGIDQWRTGSAGLTAGDIGFQVTSQELRGAIEPQIGAGTEQGGGSGQAFSPIPERIEHLVARAVSWIQLARKENAAKKVAVVYWDREMGKGELMRGSATGMFLNAPRSLVRVLSRMKSDGYRVDPCPANEKELVEWMKERGRQIGIWAPDDLDALARSENAVLVPAATYRTWLEAKVPEARRRELIERWGEAPGRLSVWHDEGGKDFIVIPRIDLGNVTLLPQPLRGEAQDSSLLHDKRVPPPHNYLATYFWLQEQFGADAVVHFGTHGSELLLPGRAVGLGRDDWSDMVMGTVPNINPWVLNNLGESLPVRRRAYAVLIDYLVPPSVGAGISDELLNLHDDIDKWAPLEEGALKKRFARLITEQVRAQHLDRDLHVDVAADGTLSTRQVEAVRSYLHDIADETTPVSLHVLGQSPGDEERIPWIVTCLRGRFLDALGKMIPPHPGEDAGADNGAGRDDDRPQLLRDLAEQACRFVLREGLEPSDALRLVGVDRNPEKTGRDGMDKGGLPRELADGFKLARRLDQGFSRAGLEIDNLMAALDGRYIAPGPGNSPDRNPSSLPTGRNMYLMNPEEVPSRPSWDLGKTLIDAMLSDQRGRQGKYPAKVAFSLSSFATFQDYGVMEAQILYLMGVRPLWDQRNLVTDVELIPAGELDRPRIDVFIAANSYYRDMLPSRMRLLDKAVRLVAALDEPGNTVFENSRQIRAKLTRKGCDPQKAERLSRARLFGYPPGQYGSAAYYYLVERSGEWNTRKDLANVYIEQNSYVYTDGLWGRQAPQAYKDQIQGCDLVLRNWSDRTRSPLSNKYTWYLGGSLSLAIEHLTGRGPEWYLSDVRDPDRAGMVRAEDALRKEFRVRLFNRKWIEGMMKEGYAGADQVAVHVSNAMGWAIMRRGSVSDDLWQEIVDVYLRDSRHLNIREWFESENPFAFQDLSEILLETIRKGYWSPGASTVAEIAQAYAESIVRHGEGGGLRGGGNTKLDSFVRKALEAPGRSALQALAARYAERSARPAGAPDRTAQTNRSPPETEHVEGRRLEKASRSRPETKTRGLMPPPGVLATALGLLLVLAVGFWKKVGVPR